MIINKSLIKDPEDWNWGTYNSFLKKKPNQHHQAPYDREALQNEELIENQQTHFTLNKILTNSPIPDRDPKNLKKKLSSKPSKNWETLWSTWYIYIYISHNGKYKRDTVSRKPEHNDKMKNNAQQRKR